MPECEAQLLPALSRLFADPSAAWSLPPEQARALLPIVAALKAVLQARAVIETRVEAPAPAAVLREDRLLTVKEAAVMLGLTPKGVYARQWPFTVRLEGNAGSRAIRYSNRGIQRYIRERLESGLG